MKADNLINSNQDSVVKKLDFNIETLSSKDNKETVRISDDLIKNENMFIAHLFKTEYLISDKSAKSHHVLVDSELLKIFSQITKLLRNNNVYNINSIIDFYILQLMVIEQDFRLCYSQRDKSLVEIKSRNERIKTLEDELKFLKERVKEYEKQTNGEKQLEMFEKEVHKIREKLVEKTNELFNFENYHNEIQIQNKSKINEINQQQGLIIDENVKIKAIMLDLVSAYKNGNDNDLKSIVAYLAENASDFEEKNTIAEKINIEREKLNKELSEIEGNSSVTTNTLNSQDLEKEVKNEKNKQMEEKFAQKVINEFDKILKDEFKRVERFYKRDNQANRKKSSLSNSDRRKNSLSGKSYVVWKQNNSAANWTDNLRGRKNEEQTKIESKMEAKIDFQDLKDTKSRIRSSIRNVDKLFDVTPVKKPDDLEFILKSSQAAAFSATNLSKLYENNTNRSHSQAYRDENTKKMIKKGDFKREKFEDNLRKALFSYKHKI